MKDTVSRGSFRGFSIVLILSMLAALLVVPSWASQVRAAGAEQAPPAASATSTRTIRPSSIKLGQRAPLDLSPKTGSATPQPGTQDVTGEEYGVTPAGEAPGGPALIAGWGTVMSEDFEGSFPSGLWNAYDDDVPPAHGEYYWDDTTYKPHTGTKSAWAARGGADGLDPATNDYPNFANSWMVYGPFDLSTASLAELDFYFWSQTEYIYDYFGWYASTDNSNFYGYATTGDWSSWYQVSFDLTSVYTLGDITGESNVWIAFVLQSDYIGTEKGPFVDDIVLQSYTGDLGTTCYMPTSYEGPARSVADRGGPSEGVLSTALETTPADIEIVPPAPDFIKELEAKGYSAVDIYNLTARHPRRIDKPQRIYTSVVGTKKALVLMVAFPKHRMAAVSQPSFYDDLLFSDGTYAAPGSMRDFYQENSYNTFDVQGTVPDCVLAPHDSSYYAFDDGTHDYGFGPYPTNAQGLVVDAVNAVDSVVDFSQYAPAGTVEGLFVVHQGQGAEVGAMNAIWSHSWELSDTSSGSPGPVTVDGVQVDPYTMEPEYVYSPGDSTVGVFAHEYGHFLGLPDLYDTTYTSEGAGVWSLMAGGSWNGTDGDSPASLDAWSKIQLGWITPTVLGVNRMDVTIPPVYSSPSTYKVWTDATPGNEYFLLENRQQTGFDSALPGEGLLIWHIDEAKTDNDSACSQVNNWVCGATHALVALEQADGLFDLENYNDSGDTGDPFPGSTSNHNFTFASTPNSSSYASSADTKVRVNNITVSGSDIVADLVDGVDHRTPTDFDRDFSTEPAKYVPSAGAVYFYKSSTSTWDSTFIGSDGEYILNSDFDGDLTADPAKYVDAAGAIWYLGSADSLWHGVYIGNDGDFIPASDFDGDGVTDPAKYVAAAGAVWYLGSVDNTWYGVYIGSLGGGVYIPGSDFDGDGKTDPAHTDAAGNVWYLGSADSTLHGHFIGSDGPYVSRSDYDGDGKADPAKFVNPYLWYLQSDSGYALTYVELGLDAAFAVPGSDFDGDGITDFAKFVYTAPHGSIWYTRSSDAGSVGVYMGADTYDIVN